VVVLALAFALSGLGVPGVRIVFGHLFMLAIVLSAMRRGMRESRMWSEVRERSTVTLASFKELVGTAHVDPLLFLTGMYGLWNLMAGTNGFSLPYILRTVGAQSQAMSVGLQACSFLLVGLGVLFVFMPLVDHTNQ